MYSLSQIWIYPVKGLSGISLETTVAEPRGLRYDRRWMLCDEQGRFVTQREIPAMTQIGMAIEGDHLVAFRRDTPDNRLHMPLHPDTANLAGITVQIWGDTCTARAMPPAIGAWFSAQLGQSLRLVYMDSGDHRPVDPNYAPAGQTVSFADGYPFLIIGQAALDHLNERLPTPLPMNRFRPNFVFTGGEPHEEDGWRDFHIGDVAFQGVKPCARCPVPTIDQDTGQRGAEPLKTLASYRQQGHKILFGQNLILKDTGSAGSISVGDVLRVAD